MMPNRPVAAGPKMFLQPRSGDKDIVVNALGFFDGFHVGATTPASLVGFVQDVGKPFFVDPMAYMFALAPEQVRDGGTGKIRRSMSSLAEQYSPLLVQTVGKRRVTPEDLKRSDLLEDLTCNVLESQRSKFRAKQMPLFEKYYDKYDALVAEGVGVEHVVQASTPSLLLTPSFLIQELDDPWYTTNLVCARMATEHKKVGEKLYASLFLSKDVIEQPGLSARILSDFSDRGFDGIAIWINNLSEESASVEALSNLLALTEGFHALGKPVIKLHGGFFSILMSEYGVSGFSCGLSFKSFRDILAYRWMAPAPPKPKFYIAGLHQSYPLDVAARIQTEFPFLRCDCAACKVAYGEDSDRFISGMERDGYCQNHFLNIRKREIESFRRTGLTGAIEEIDETIGKLRRKNATGVRHLTKWRNLMGGAQLVGVGAELLAQVKTLEGHSQRLP